MTTIRLVCTVGSPIYKVHVKESTIIFTRNKKKVVIPKGGREPERGILYQLARFVCWSESYFENEAGGVDYSSVVFKENDGRKYAGGIYIEFNVVSIKPDSIIFN